MSDFVDAALSWIALGIAVAVFITYMNSTNKTKNKKK